MNLSFTSLFLTLVGVEYRQNNFVFVYVNHCYIMIRFSKHYLTYMTLPGLERKNKLTKFEAKRIQIIL